VVIIQGSKNIGENKKIEQERVKKVKGDRKTKKREKKINYYRYESKG